MSIRSLLKDRLPVDADDDRCRLRRFANEGNNR